MFSRDQKLSQYFSDLAQVQHSKSLLDIFNVTDTVSPCDYFGQLDLDSDVAQQALEGLYTPPPNRMGRYFEQLIFILLQQLVGKERILRSLLIRDGKQVVGEADFVFLKDNNSGLSSCIELDHWEIACKFYLFVGKTSDDLDVPNLYQGLHLKDNLKIKLKHLSQKQLKIFETKVGKQSLKKSLQRLTPNNEGKPYRITSKSLMIGRFYYPHSQIDELSVNAGDHGIWFSLSEMEILNKKDYRFAILTNNELLQRMNRVDIEFVEFKQRITTIFHDYRRAGVFFTYLDSTGKRFQAVIVSDQWMYAVGVNGT